MSETCSISADPMELAAPRQTKEASAPVNANARRVSVAAGYEMWAPTYDRDPNPLLALEARHLLPHLASCHGKDALDLGCGTGRWLAKLIALGARSAIGMDLSSSMLWVAAGKPPLAGRLIMGNCCSLPIRSKAANFVISSFTLSHIADEALFAKELARVARPGADIFITDLHPDAYARGWRTGFRDRSGPTEVVSVARPLDHVCRVFGAQGLRLTEFREPRLGPFERPIFAASGKDHLFVEAASLPAVLICHFLRSD